MKHFGKWNGDRCMHLVSEMSYKFLHSIMCFLNTLQKSKVFGIGKGHSN
jgi:hypothetical protein